MHEGTLRTEYGNLHFVVNGLGAVTVYTENGNAEAERLEGALVCNTVPHSLNTHLIKGDGGWQIQMASTWIRRADRFSNDEATDSARGKIHAEVVKAWREYVAVDPLVLLFGEKHRLKVAIARAVEKVKEAKKDLSTAQTTAASLASECGMLIERIDAAKSLL